MNEVIKAVLNFFYKILQAQKAPKVPKDSFKRFIYFFYGKILHAQKAQKEYKAPKSTKKHQK